MPGVSLYGDFLSAQSEIYRKFVFRLMVFLFPDELYFLPFSELCFASPESIYLPDPDWSQSQAAVGLPQILLKQAKNIVTPENATNSPHTKTYVF